LLVDVAYRRVVGGPIHPRLYQADQEEGVMKEEPMRLNAALVSPLPCDLATSVQQFRETIRQLKEARSRAQQALNQILVTEAETCFPELKGKPLNLSVSDDSNFLIITKGRGFK
jgi:hypothetical protein